VPDLVPILNVVLALGVLLVLGLGLRRLLSRFSRTESAIDPNEVLRAAHERIDEIELARARSMLERR
jgi:hypothetical protein